MGPYISQVNIPQFNMAHPLKIYGIAILIVTVSKMINQRYYCHNQLKNKNNEIRHHKMPLPYSIEMSSLGAHPLCHSRGKIKYYENFRTR